MFVPSTIQKRLAGFGLAVFGRDRRSAHGRSKDRTRARPQLEGLEDRCLLSGISGITEYPNPSSNPYSWQITTGPDGSLWFTEGSLTTSQIGMINPTTGAITDFTTPTAYSAPRGITTGPDGNLWFTEWQGQKIGVINPSTHVISEFSLPSVSNPQGITAGPDGNLWFTEQGDGTIDTLNLTTHVISEFPLPSPQSDPQGITVGPDGNLWFTEAYGGKIGTLNLTTHVITEFPIPKGTSGALITAGPDGNLWFTDPGANAIGQINPATGAIAEFPIPSANASPWAITAGPAGNLWFSEGGVGKIGMINPSTDAITEFPVPYTGASPRAITVGPDGNLWFTDSGTKSIGVAFLTTSNLVVTQQPPSTITAGSSFGLTVTAENSSGNPITSFDRTVTVALASNPGGATLGGTLTATASGGVATFSGLTLTTAGSGYKLDVSASGLGAGFTSAITVTPAAAPQVAITEEPPASVTAGSGFGLQATIEDAYGNAETGDNAVVTVALATEPAGATLGGTLSVTASNGVATFSGLTLTRAASGYTLQASSSGLSSATSSAITVTPGAATQVVITQQPPASVTVNAGFGLQVTVEDAFGNVETSASNTVKVALENNPTRAKLGGTLSDKASKGVATFSGLTLNKAGSDYTLQVSSSGLTSATTSAITVTSTAAIVLAAAAAPANAPDPLLAPLVLDQSLFLDALTRGKRRRAT